MEIRKLLPYQNIHYWLCALVAFLIPFYDIIVSYAMALLIVNWLVGIASVNGVKTTFKNPFFILIMILYLFYFFSDLRSLTPDGRFDLIEKTSLLIFPVILFSSFSFSRKQVVTIINTFVIGCFFACFIALIHAVILYFYYHQFAFYYIPLATFHHPGYLAMYVDMSIAGILYNLFYENIKSSQVKKGIVIIQLLFFTLFLALLTSKMGSICYVIIIIITCLIQLIRRQNIIKAIGYTIGLLSFFLIASQFLVLKDYNRFSHAETVIENQQLAPSSVESTNVRVFVWRSAVEVIKRNVLLGVGVGNTEDSLMRQYEKSKVTGAWSEHLNAHNQFLQTTIALGIFGGLIFLINIFYPALFCFKYSNYIYIIFLMIFFMNCLTESVLESQAGIVFYGFFSALLAKNITVFKREDTINTAAQ